MKKFISIALTLVLAFSCLNIFVGAESTTEALPADAVIVTADNANTYEQAAAQRLRERLSQLFGLRLPVVTKAGDRFGLYIGSASDIDMSGKADGSYILRSVDNGVALAGSGTRGNIAAVYAFLENFGGCKVYTRERGMTTQQMAIMLPENIDINYTPFFEYTETDWHSPHDTEYSLMNGLNGGIYRSIPGELGGTVNYISTFAHSLTTQFCPAAKYFDDHPKYFALHNGKRTGDQLCLTNEDTYKIVEAEVFAFLAQRHDPSAALQIISITQNDNQHYCECADCRALDRANGSHAGTMITFVNRIARAVAAAGYDNVGIDTFAYQYTRSAPSKVIPEPNVIIRLCSIECCFSHTLDDPKCSENKAFIKDLEDWSRLSQRLYIWDYTTNYANTVGPFPDFGVLQRNMQIFYEHNARGVYEEGNYYVDSCDAEFGELRAYLISKLLQDPYCDYEGEMNGFLKAYYGDGWQSLREYIDLTSKAAARVHVSLSEDMIETFLFMKGEPEQADKLWETAKSAAEGEELDHVLRSELSWRFWKASAGIREFMDPNTAVNARRQLEEDLEKYGVTTIHEGATNPLHPLYMYVPAQYWHDKADVRNVFEKVFFVVSRHWRLMERYIRFMGELIKDRI
ncbi:MAG: DUF4838 domain-containing protein [Clostridiales bacterium]|nr:DUF4838 domain-containing protein [Clostridiales bacterium]